ncbi:MAG: hypothetical protein K5696_03635 [Lachnospiraceae bacterium]|nr:hypothetical protein [Lachnospiraceae bacterium]
MVCKYCGAENEEGSLFCCTCGKRIGSGDAEENRGTVEMEGAEPAGSDTDAETSEAETDHTAEAAGPASNQAPGTAGQTSGPEPEMTGPVPDHAPFSAEPADGGKGSAQKWLPLILLAAVAVVALVLLLGRLLADSLPGGGKDAQAVPLWACVDGQDTAYIQFANGKHSRIEDAESAAVTPDRKLVVVLDTAKDLYVTDAGLKNKTPVAEEVDYFNIHDRVITYRAKDGTYLYRCDKKESVRLSKEDCDGFCFSEKGGNLLYGMGSSIYLLTDSMKEPEKIGKFDEDWKPLYLSDDGSVAYWALDTGNSEGRDNTYEIYSFRKGERNKVCKYDAVFFPNLMFNKSQSYGILAQHDRESLYVLDKKGNAVKVGFGNPLDLRKGYIYTAKTSFYEDESSSFPGMYFAVQGNDDKTSRLYYVDKKGEREKVMSDIEGDWCVADGYLYYMTDDELHCAKLNGESVTKDERIAADIDRWLSARDGYIYYVRDIEKDKNGNEFGTVYVYKKGKKTVKVSSDVWLKEAFFSPDGKTVYFFKDPNKYYDNATLYRSEFGRKTAVRIADSVCLSGISDGTGNTYENLLGDRFTFYREIDKQDYHWMFYNGKEAFSMVEGLRSEDLN